MEHRTRENRARRIARREGLLLFKSHSRDPAARDYGLYVLVDDSRRGNRLQRVQTATSAFAHGRGRSLEEIERYLHER